MKLYGFIKDGKLSPGLKQLFVTAIGIMEGKNVVIDITEQKGKRSSQSNRYFHLLLNVFKDELNSRGNNFTLELTKDLVKSKFLLKEVVDADTGELLGTTLGHTSALNTEEMTELIEKMKAWAAEMGIILPEASEQIELM